MSEFKFYWLWKKKVFGMTLVRSNCWNSNQRKSYRQLTVSDRTYLFGMTGEMEVQQKDIRWKTYLHLHSSLIPSVDQIVDLLFAKAGGPDSIIVCDFIFCWLLTQGQANPMGLNPFRTKLGWFFLASSGQMPCLRCRFSLRRWFQFLRNLINTVYEAGCVNL